MNYLVIYQKASGELLYRIRHSKPMLDKGTITSMGWLVVDVKCLKNGKCYTTYDYSHLVNTQIAIHSVIRKLCNKNVLMNILVLVLLYIIFVKLK